LPIASGQVHLTTAQIAERVSPSVVVIEGKTDSGDVLGSGFIVSKDGKIVTNLHVIRDMKTVSVHIPGRPIGHGWSVNGEAANSVFVLATDEPKDLVIIKIEGVGLPVLGLGNSDALTVGEAVVVVGSPLGLEATVTAGILSAIRNGGEGFKFLQTDAAVNHGTSGGPLVAANGLAVGVVSSILRSDAAQGLNFAIPINYVRGLLENLHKPVSFAEMRRTLAVPSTTDENDGPSLKETLDWLRDKIMLSTANYKRRFRVPTTGDVVIEPVTLGGAVVSMESCKIVFGDVQITTVEQYPEWQPMSIKTTYTVSLGNLSDWSVVKAPSDGWSTYTFVSGEEWGYRLLLSSASKDIYRLMWFSDPQPHTMAANVDSLNLFFNDESLARRVAGAFHHAADLCKKDGPREPF
jgi:hypothetical protein